MNKVSRVLFLSLAMVLSVGIAGCYDAKQPLSDARKIFLRKVQSASAGTLLVNDDDNVVGVLVLRAEQVYLKPVIQTKHTTPQAIDSHTIATATKIIEPNNECFTAYVIRFAAQKLEVDDTAKTAIRYDVNCRV